MFNGHSPVWGNFPKLGLAYIYCETCHQGSHEDFDEFECDPETRYGYMNLEGMIRTWGQPILLHCSSSDGFTITALY